MKLPLWQRLALTIIVMLVAGQLAGFLWGALAELEFRKVESSIRVA